MKLAPAVKWILYGLMAAVVLFVAVRYWSRLVEILMQLWAEYLAVNSDLFNKKASGGHRDLESVLSDDRHSKSGR